MVMNLIINLYRYKKDRQARQPKRGTAVVHSIMHNYYTLIQS